MITTKYNKCIVFFISQLNLDNKVFILSLRDMRVSVFISNQLFMQTLVGPCPAFPM